MQAAKGRLGDTVALMVPCDDSDPAQSFVFGTPAPGYVSNSLGARVLCLNLAGCDPVNDTFTASFLVQSLSFEAVQLIARVMSERGSARGGHVFEVSYTQ